MSKDDLLLALRDIQVPASASWWPPGPAWWLSAVLILLVSAFLFVIFKRRYQLRYFNDAHYQLQQIITRFTGRHDQDELLLSLSCWLRLVAMQAYPQHKIAGVIGTAWLDFLDECMEGTGFRQAAGEVFGGRIYQQSPEVNATEVILLCQQWLDSVKPALLQQGRG